jgi:predicted nucleotidyltransferase
MIFDDNYIDFINLLKKYEVKFVLVGGLAVVVHGHYRTTKDMDLFYECSEENCLKLIKSINDFGFKYLNLSIEDLMDSSGYVKLGNAPVRIDLFCDLPGVNFEEVYKMAFDYTEDGIELKVIHVNHLIQNKLTVGRDQDLSDAKKLKKIIELKNRRK